MRALRLPRSARSRFTAVLASAAFLLPTATAQAAQSAPAAPARHCVVVLDQLRPGESASRVLSRDCATGTEAPAPTGRAAAATLLMTWYADIDYGGDSTQIRGSYGGCNAEGYGFAYVGDAWNDRISSFKTFNSCDTVSGYDHANYGLDVYYCGRCGSGGTFSEPYVGNNANDRISSWWISRS
ncbi:hypothetical protein NX801_05130 [Streptomyces sp. LP05-1]|uniref:Secreted protein n=1 Tax=Streptomyces pyxinae TaxID=2970734 RepID=A0ABT2CCA5_9ACTN|nr:hypothetical protein [Streptomyces sp. LP05-1]MCS0635049.1 hypothetical protein [Streptomyces sp. LP05-1]